MMARFGSEKQYNEQIINHFKKAETPEIIIVVDKLLTGFDAPKNAVFYITKPLREHSLLQAIARVNRLSEGKDYGLVIDYYGVLGELDEAINTYSALEVNLLKHCLSCIPTCGAPLKVLATSTIWKPMSNSWPMKNCATNSTVGFPPIPGTCPWRCPRPSSMTRQAKI
jgi:hypothetical protein